jgi:hypothetical protein
MTEFTETYQPPIAVKSEAVAQSNRKRKIITDALMLALNREIDNNGVMTKRINVIADQIVLKACEGDVSAFKEVRDTVEGKPLQAIEASGPDGGPIPITTIRLVAGGG